MKALRCGSVLGVGVAMIAATSACGGRLVVAPKARSAATIGAAGRFFGRYVTGDGRVIRHDQGNDIVSEGQALAMLIAEISGRPDTVATIWAWTKSHLQRPDGLISFHATGDGTIIDSQPAADADILAAYALLRYEGTDAGGLHQDGKRLASAVMEHETVRLPDGTPVVLPGPWAASSRPVVNPSYWMPSVFRWLGTATGDPRWSQSGMASLSLLTRMTDGGRVLPPDWARLVGQQVTPIASPSGTTPVQYGLDAARLPVWLLECPPGGRRLSARWWARLLSNNDRAAATALSLHGAVINPDVTPLPLIAGAAAALAAGDGSQSAQLRTRAEVQAGLAPTYYGDAWVALGGALIDGSLTNC